MNISNHIRQPPRFFPRFFLSLKTWQILAPVRRWIDQIEVCDRRMAHRLCQMIPHSCPFERDITLLKYTLHIPALCTLNPLYYELVSLRFRALTYLAEVCGEDIKPYVS